MERAHGKILWITDNFPPGIGGVQTYLYNTVVSLPRMRSIVVCRDYPEPRRADIDATLRARGDEIHRIADFPQDPGVYSLCRSFRSIVRLFRLVARIASRQAVSAIIVGHATFFTLYVMYLLSYLSDTPVAIVLHGEDIPDIRLRSNRLRRRLFNRADFFICNSTFTRQRLARFCAPAVPVFVAYPGVEERFFAYADGGSLRNRFRVGNRRVILSVGRLDPRKGHALVIEALPRIIVRFPDILYLIGGRGEGQDALREKVAALELQDHVIFCGAIPDGEIVAFHQLAHVFVMPNRVLTDGDTEGFGIVFLEAGACGKPVIGGACGGALDAVENGASGYLVDPHDTGALAEKILLLLSRRDEAERMGEYGRHRAACAFRWPVLGAKLEQFLERVV